jgi:hypothetical protein
VEEDKGFMVGVNVVMRYGLVCKKVTILKFFFSLLIIIYLHYTIFVVCVVSVIVVWWAVNVGHRE